MLTLELQSSVGLQRQRAIKRLGNKFSRRRFLKPKMLYAFCKGSHQRRSYQDETFVPRCGIHFTITNPGCRRYYCLQAFVDDVYILGDSVDE